MSGKQSQRKGRDGERELSELLNNYGYHTKTGRALNFGKEPDLNGLTDIHIECKRGEKLNLANAVQQAVTDSQKFNDGLPAVFHRKNRQAWLVTMRLQDWIILYENSRKTDKRPTVKQTADLIE